MLGRGEIVLREMGGGSLMELIIMYKASEPFCVTLSDAAVQSASSELRGYEITAPPHLGEAGFTRFHGFGSRLDPKTHCPHIARKVQFLTLQYENLPELSRRK